MLEQLFKLEWIENRPIYSFGLGMAYSFIGILSAVLIFGSTPSLMTVAFASILLIPSLNKLLSLEEKIEIRENKFSLTQIFHDHKNIFEIYFYLFMGVFTTFAAAALVVKPESTINIFSSQLAAAGITGKAFAFGKFQAILINNLLVFAVCFILSLVYGAGSILFLVWNASVWGAVFGYAAHKAALGAAGSISIGSPFTEFGATILPVLPHLVTEAASYLTAAIAGGVLSKAVLKEKLFSDEFRHIMTDSLIFFALGFVLVVIAAVIEVGLFF